MSGPEIKLIRAVGLHSRNLGPPGLSLREGPDWGQSSAA